MRKTLLIALLCLSASFAFAETAPETPAKNEIATPVQPQKSVPILVCADKEGKKTYTNNDACEKGQRKVKTITAEGTPETGR